jgi:hypothetical protein
MTFRRPLTAGRDRFALNDTNAGMQLERHTPRLIRGWGAPAGVEKDPGSLGFARDDTRKKATGKRTESEMASPPFCD